VHPLSWATGLLKKALAKYAAKPGELVYNPEHKRVYYRFAPDAFNTADSGIDSRSHTKKLQRIPWIDATVK